MKLKSIAFLGLLMLSNMLSGQQSIKDINIGFLGDGLPKDEFNTAAKFLNEHFSNTTPIQSNGPLRDEINQNDFTHLWIYQRNSITKEYLKESFGEDVREFVKDGGNLVLSMEAVRLLNDWKIEKELFETRTDTVVDNGFGRPLGFHGFKSHPIYEGLHGGAYISKAKEDQVVRKTGFFDEQVPQDSLTKVIGTEWTYITFHENNKLVFEYKYGKGKIIAVGAFTYFGMDNFNQHELFRFYENIFKYLAGNHSDIHPNYWDYNKKIIAELEYNFPVIAPVPSSKWEEENLSISHKSKATESPAIVTGRRMMAIGQQSGGIDEIWTHPFMAFRDIKTGVRKEGSDEIIWLHNLTPIITISPELIVREYHIGNTVLKEMLTVSNDKPIGVLHYQWEGKSLQKLFVTWTSNFRYMWPYSQNVSGSLKYKWSDNLNAAVVTAQNDQLVNFTSFSQIPASYLIGNYGEVEIIDDKIEGKGTELHQVMGGFSFDLSNSDGSLNVSFLGDEGGIEKGLALLQEESKHLNDMFKQTSSYYKKLLSERLSVVTPDQKFNEGYKWALLRTDQFFQETPSMGTSMVAGIGSTARGWNGYQKISGRPGYAWYFGRDAQWCGFAVNAYGGTEQVKKILKLFKTYQNLNGKIFHELTTSGAVHYDASDSTPLYVVLAAHYLKYTGDVEFIKSIWPSIEKAMDFCYSTDTDNDGLIEITNVGHGWVEGGALFGTHTEVYLAGCWAAALDAASYMAKEVNKPQLSTDYNSDAVKVKNIIDKKFWNPDGEYFYHAKMKDGTFMDQETVLAAIPVYFNAIEDDQKAIKTGASFAGIDYSTDWGVRIIPNTSERYHPGSYHAGMVWPLFSGWASLAEYKTGNLTSGYNHMFNNLLVYDDWGYGSVEETLNGDIYKPAGVCSQQGWSETMVLQPIYEGMLGIEPDAPNNKLSLKPAFPWHWNTVEVSNIKFGKNVLDFQMKKNNSSTIYNITKNGTDSCMLNFTPQFPLGTKIISVKVNGVEIPYRNVLNSESVAVHLENISLNNKDLIEINHTGGIGAIAYVSNPTPNNSSNGLFVVDQKLEDDVYNISVEGYEDNSYDLRVVSNSKIKKIENARLTKKTGNVYHLKVNFPNGDTTSRKEIQIKIKP